MTNRVANLCCQLNALLVCSRCNKKLCNDCRRIELAKPEYRACQSNKTGRKYNYHSFDIKHD